MSLSVQSSWRACQVETLLWFLYILYIRGQPQTLEPFLNQGTWSIARTSPLNKCCRLPMGVDARLALLSTGNTACRMPGFPEICWPQPISVGTHRNEWFTKMGMSFWGVVFGHKALDPCILSTSGTKQVKLKVRVFLKL